MYVILLLFIVFYQTTMFLNVCNYISPILLLLGLISFIFFNNNYTLTLLILILYFVCIVKKTTFTEESNTEESNTEESNTEEHDNEESDNEEPNIEEHDNEETNNKSTNAETNNEKNMYLLLNSKNIDYNINQIIDNPDTQLDKLENNDTFCK